MGAPGRLGHAVLEPPLGVVAVAQKLNALVTQLQDLGDDRVVVALVAVVTARIVGPPNLLPQIALIGERQKRIHRRSGVGDGVLALVVLVGRGGRRGLDERVRQAAQLVLGDVLDVALLIGEHVVGEPRVDLGEPLVDRGVSLFRFSLQCRPVAREAVVRQPDEALLVGSQ